MALDDSLKGFAVTFRQMLRKPETIGYPERKTPVFPRFRGRHRLWRHDNGLEKCVGCSLCVAACPFDAITLEAEYEMSERTRGDLLYDKEMLLAPHPKPVPLRPEVP